ncbi:unnamed protein product [Urochloa decumbens]|uniref:Glycosyltransferase n=1 Tax=Urochloa decumbens TaxID=240449 RepID=A0ABC9B5B1_9POAL
MLPYLELSERLASRGHRVSYVYTQLAGDGAVDLVPLTLPRVEGLPDGAESTNDVPGDRLEPLWQDFDALAAPFADYLAAAADADGKPDWTGCSPTRSTTGRLSSPASTACRVPTPAIPRYEWHGNAPLFAVVRGMSIARRASLTLERCAIAAMRSCPEWEPGAFHHAAALLDKPLVPLGLLPPSPDGGRAGAHGDDDKATVRWLDAQPTKSVVYVALGREVPLRVELVHELAHGLELAGTRFLWALRKPRGVDDDVLPAGFLDRTKGCGLVTMGWVPQISILAHGAVGGFLTHCGWNSLIEGLLYGHPLVMLPIFGDQGPNSRLMEGRKVGLMVARNEDDGSFDRHGIASAVKGVMIEEDTRKIFVENAKKMQEIVADKELQDRYVDEFVQHLRSYITDHGNSSAADAPPPVET